ncbi:HIT family protein [Nannocystis pusilla]|uniref:HIT family protein n=1 Tax=Nannocystis pusilla TaxID=889268 RepID=UPI003B7B15B8
MPLCPFCAIPDSQIVWSDELVIAVRDLHPVSRGHTLVIPRRHVATWFDASAAEREAIWRAVDAIKTMLDASDRPAGYNVGFNAGLPRARPSCISTCMSSRATSATWTIRAAGSDTSSPAVATTFATRRRSPRAARTTRSPRTSCRSWPVPKKSISCPHSCRQAASSEFSIPSRPRCARALSSGSSPAIISRSHRLRRSSSSSTGRPLGRSGDARGQGRRGCDAAGPHALVPSQGLAP